MSTLVQLQCLQIAVTFCTFVSFTNNYFMSKPRCPFKQYSNSLPIDLRLNFKVLTVVYKTLNGVSPNPFPSVIPLTQLLSFWPLLFTEQLFFHSSQSIWTCYVIGHSPDTLMVLSNFIQICMQMHPIQRDFPLPSSHSV